MRASWISTAPSRCATRRPSRRPSSGSIRTSSSSRSAASSDDEEDLERTLDLLADVPAGKLVISEARVSAREQVVALENAGVDAILVGAEVLQGSADFASALAELTGR